MKEVPCSIETTDPMNFQFNLMVESLIRDNPGKIECKSYNVTHRRTSARGLAEIFESFGQDGYNVVMDERYTFYLFHPKLCVWGNFRIDEKEKILFTTLSIYSSEVNHFWELLRTKGFRKYIPKELDTLKVTQITYAFPGGMGMPNYKHRSFDNLYLKDIACNYSPEVVEKTEALIKYTYEAKHGLVVLSGPVGTGKSYLIRSILTEINDEREAVVCNPATTFLKDVNLLHGVASNFDRSFLVFEDVGDMLTTTASHNHMDAKSNLLNMSEGFLSLLMDTIILVSFNYKIEDVDPAITRPGRCLANINVGLLPYEHAQSLVGFSIPEKDEVSLAEVYELRRLKALE